jgi:hypothetical protein
MITTALAIIGAATLSAIATALLMNECNWHDHKKHGSRSSYLRYEKSWRGKLRRNVVENYPRLAWVRYPEYRQLVSNRKSDAKVAS